MEAVWLKAGGVQCLTGVLLPVVCLSFCGRDVADGLEQAAMVEPVDPFERGQFDSLAGLPGPAVDHLGFVQAIDRLGQGIVVAVALAADGGFDAGLGQAFGVANADVLRPAVRMMNQCAIALGTAGVQRLLERIEHEVGAHGAGDAPADDAAGIDVDDEGDIDEALPGGDIGVSRPWHCSPSPSQNRT